MTVRSIVPRNNNEGSLGTQQKQWGAIRAKNIYIDGVDVSTDVVQAASVASAKATIATTKASEASASAGYAASYEETARNKANEAIETLKTSNLIKTSTSGDSVVLQNSTDIINIKTNISEINSRNEKLIGLKWNEGYLGNSLTDIFYSDSAFRYTNLIHCKEGEVIEYRGDSKNQYVSVIKFYNKVGYPIQYLSNVSTSKDDKLTCVAPQNACFVRMTAKKSQVDDGSAYIFSNGLVYSDVLNNFTTSELKYAKKSIGKNLFNKNTVIEGYYINNDGNVKINNQCFVSDFIPVNSGQYVYNNHLTSYACGYVVYDKDYNKISYGVLSDLTNGIITIGSDNSYLVISSYVSQLSTSQIEKGSYASSYEEYTESSNLDEIARDVNGLKNVVGNKSLEKTSLKSANFSSGNRLSILAPSIKTHNIISFSANVTSLGRLKIGNGENQVSSGWIEIDATNVYVYSKRQDDVLQATYQHGLTIEHTLSININSTSVRKANISICSESGQYSKNDIYWEGCQGLILAIAKDNCNLTNVELSYYPYGIKEKEFWAFGDSYFDMWTVNYANEGHDKVLFDGISGRKSASAYTSLIKCLEYGTPKTIIWCMGMNDEDSSTSVNSSWQQTINAVIGLCNTKNINLILYTVPNVPERNHSFKNSFIRNSGYRYVDVSKAVGAEESTSWYDDLLLPDNTHPASKGCKVIADKMIADIPEIY